LNERVTVRDGIFNADGQLRTLWRTCGRSRYRSRVGQLPFRERRWRSGAILCRRPQSIIQPAL
jgi:hypothetical protein